MNIQFESLDLVNFRSIKEAHLDFIPGLHLVVGYNRVDEHSISNGAGKSALLPYSIPYILFGRFQEPSGEITRTGFQRRGEDFCTCTLKLKIDGEDIIVERGRKKDKPWLRVTGAETPIRGDQELSSLVGCDFHTLTSLLVLTRASVEGGLFYGTDAKRKDFFLSLAGIDKLITGSVEVLKGLRSKYSLEALELKTAYEVENRFGDLSGEMDTIRSEITSSKNKIITCLEKIDNFQVEIDACLQKKSSYDDLISDHETRALQLSQIHEQFKVLDEKYQAKGQLQATIQHLQERIKITSTERKKVESLSGGKCPTCYQVVPEKYALQVVKNFTEFQNTCEATLSSRKIDFDNVISEIEELEDLRISVVRKLNESKSVITKAQEDRSKVEVQMTRFSAEHDANLRSIQEYQETLEKLYGQLQILQDTQKQRQVRISSLSEDHLCFYNLDQACAGWTTFLKRTLPAYALREMAVSMSAFTDRCLKSLWDSRMSLNVSFDSTNEDLKIEIMNAVSELISIKSLSAGEQARIFLALALGSIIATRSFRGWSSNIFILDEVFDMLDRSGREVVYSLLDEMAVRFNLCVYVISHHEQPSNAKSVYMMVKDIDGSILQLAA
jgi:DNA repair exonuclease SbcCD ATPase subunit